MASAALRPSESFHIEDAKATGEEKTDSFLNPTGAAKGVPIPKEKAIGRYGELGLFGFFVLTRAVHPTIINESKTVIAPASEGTPAKMGFAYSSLSTVIVFQIFVLTFFQLLILGTGGLRQWKSIWKNKKALMVFGFNGFIFAIGDWLEMESMGGLGGAIYQVLQQSKFIITAILIRHMKGVTQTRLQWTLLISLMVSMSLFSTLHKDKGGSGIQVWGMMCAFFKVFTGAFGSVMTDKYSKEFKDIPTHVMIVQMGMARFATTLLLSLMSFEEWQHGLFHDWDILTCGVTLSFMVKSVSSIYIMSLLDSILKNIGETIAVILIYAWEVMPILMDPEKAFDFKPMLAVMVIVLVVGAYLDSKALVDKAKKFDALEAQKQ